MESTASGETVRALLVDAFTDEPTRGNGAGVVPDAEGLSTGQMRRIADELAQSETAFLLPSGSADRRVRYFTPEQEVDLCGHATVASHAHLHTDGVVEPGTHSLETAIGVVEVEITDDGTVWMTQDAPTVEEVDLDYATVGEALGVDPATLRDVGADLPLAVASTGLRFLVVPANFLDAVGGAAPETSAVAALCDRVDATGVYLFTFDALTPEATLHGRTFAPGAGVPEDPVTGTASGAVGAYLRRFEAFDSLPEEMTFEQGHYLDRDGHVHVRARKEIQVGGRAVTTLDGELRVPPEDDDEDEIIEA